MARLISIVGLICLVGAGALLLVSDPWTRADRKAEADAGRIAQLALQADRIGWRLTEDTTLSRAMIWDREGLQLYPPPDGLAPIQYEFSEAETRRLVSRRTEVAGSEWQPFDVARRELLYCQTAPPVCLVYDRGALEETLGLGSGELSSRSDWRTAGRFLGGFAVALAILGFWVIRVKRGTADELRLDPKRLFAKRGALEVSLTPRDMKILSLLEQRDGAVVTKDELYDAGWGREFMPNSRALDQHMINLRRKLDPDKTRPVLIETVHGVGYRMVR